MSEPLILLGDVCQIQNGFAFDSARFTTGIGMPLIRIRDIQKGVCTLYFEGPYDDAYLVNKGDLLVGMDGEFNIAEWAGEPALLNQRVCRLFTNPEKLIPEYLLHRIKADLKRIEESTPLTTVKHLSSKQIASLEWHLPCPDVQRQIASLLKAQLAEVEVARQAAQVQLREAAALKKRALESLFSSIQNWSPIGNAAKLQSGYAFKSDNFKTSGVHLLRNANILPGKVYWDDAVFLSASDSEKYPSYALNSGDVLISLDRPIISSGIKVARVIAEDLPALLVQRVGRFLIDPQKLDADYLYAYLQTDLFISKITGHDQSLGVPHISPSQVEAIEMPLPEKSVQKELSKQLNDVTSTWQVAVSAMQSQVNDLSKLPKAILAQAFD